MSRSLLRGPLSLWQQAPSFTESFSPRNWIGGCSRWRDEKRGRRGESRRGKRLNKGVKARRQGEMKRMLLRQAEIRCVHLICVTEDGERESAKEKEREKKKRRGRNKWRKLQKLG